MMKWISMENYLKTSSATFAKSGLKLRPNAGSGIWVSMLLPLSIITSLYKFPTESTSIYKMNAIVSAGIILINIFICYSIGKQNKFHVPLITVAGSAFTSFLFWICLKKSIVYSIVSGFSATLGYAYLLPFCLHMFPLAFTFGEAALCTQATVLFIFSTFVNIYNVVIECEPPHTNNNIATTILQVGILGLCLIITILSSSKALRNSFGCYFIVILVLALGVIPMLHFLLDRSPVLWILTYIFSSLSKVYIILFWAICVVLAVLCMSWQVYGGSRATTSLRKIFHILAVIVYIPGLLYECTLLYIATGVAFGLLMAIEIIRILNVSPLGPLLQAGFQTYVDEKDSGQLALTPIYLLTGCSLPIWLHPCPCDLTDSAGFQLLALMSGILSIGIGDTMASVVGSHFGIHKWKSTLNYYSHTFALFIMLHGIICTLGIIPFVDSNKSIEGTVASVASQMLLTILFMYLGFIYSTPLIFMKSTFAVVVNALVEAKTDQVDNLILPVITYILLI